MFITQINAFAVMCLCRLLEPVLYYTVVVMSKILEIKIIKIYSSRIGHLCWNVDNYKNLMDNRKKTRSRVSLFILDQTTANSSVLELIKNGLPGIYLTGRIALILSRVILIARWKKLLVPWGDLHPKESRLANTAKWVEVPKIEIDEFVEEYGLKDTKSIVFHNRDRAYLDSIGGDSNIHDFRNFSFKDYLPAIEILQTKGIKAIRIGREIEESHTLPSLLDLTGKRQNFWGDVVAVEVSWFFVSGNSGVGQLSNLLRKPHLFVNQIPFDLHHLSSFPQNSMFMPKKLRAMSNGKILSLQDSLSLLGNWSIHTPDFFSSREIEVVNNTEKELSDAVVEMLQRTSMEWKDYLNDSKINETLKYLYKDDFAEYIFGELGIKLSSSFVRNNHNWFFGL